MTTPNQTIRDNAKPQLFIDGTPFDGALPILSEVPDPVAPEDPVKSLAYSPTMTLTCTIAAHEADAPLLLLAETTQRVIKGLEKVAKAAAAAVSRLWDKLLYITNDHPKWLHLYKHAKKYRVRKKYRKLLEKQLYKKLGAIHK